MKLKISSGEACIRLWLQRACGENESGIMQRAAALQVWPIDGACFLKHIQFDDICYVLMLWKSSQTIRASDLVCLFPAWHYRMNGLEITWTGLVRYPHFERQALRMKQEHFLPYRSQVFPLTSFDSCLECLGALPKQRKNMYAVCFQAGHVGEDPCTWFKQHYGAQGDLEILNKAAVGD